MAFIDVHAWSPDHVVYWIRGLHPALTNNSMELIIRNRINGSKLLLLNSDDINELIPGIKVESLEAMLRGISSLRHLNNNANIETLQSVTLNLACQARYLYNQLVQAEQNLKLLPVSVASCTPMTGNSKSRFDFAKVDSNMQINQSTKQRVSLETLDVISVVVDHIMKIVTWLNSTGLVSPLSKFNKDFKSIVLRVALELTSTAQRDQFVEQPNDIIKKTSKFLADYCEWVVLAINDSDFIQPCWIDVVSIKKKPDEEDFGIVIQPATLVIDEIVFSLPAHRSGRVCVGDEIIQVDYQTVAGWLPGTVKELIKTYTEEIIITIRKKPSLVSLNPSIILMKPYAIPIKKVQSYSSEISQAEENEEDVTLLEVLTKDRCQTEEAPDTNENLEPPKEPKGPVYPELQINKSKRELKRRMSISGSISDALVDLSLADSLPIPSLDKATPPNSGAPNKSEHGKISKETLTKSVSHDTAKLYLHTLSIDRKHLWLPKFS